MQPPWGRYHLLRRDDVTLLDDPAPWSRGSKRAELLGSHTGTVHMSLALVSLEDGALDPHVHSYEESFFVLDGSPILCLDGRRARLRAGACGVVPVGVPHAWQEQEGRGPASWMEMAVPRRREASQPPDTFVLGPIDDSPVTDLDLRDPRNRHLFLLGDEDMDLERLGRGASVSAPTVSASMATAALAYSGITVKMLVDQRLDAQLGTMFMVAYEPGGVAHPHDHPFEESYTMLEGEVDVVADGDRYTLKPGDVFWTGAGCIHAFYEVQGKAVRWLETSSSQPPNRHSYRFERDWEYLATRLREPGQGMAPAGLVDGLARARIGGTYNQYAGSELRCERLRAYLDARAQASTILVGEAAGYRGARISGIAFTSERQLSGAGPAEATATIVHRVLTELGIEDDVLLWNVVPTHPGTATSNRRPTRAEVAASRPFLDQLVRDRRVIAVGRVAASALEHAHAIRHPSHGGAQPFADGLRRTLGL